jgi:hypothetical protein
MKLLLQHVDTGSPQSLTSLLCNYQSAKPEIIAIWCCLVWSTAHLRGGEGWVTSNDRTMVSGGKPWEFGEKPTPVPHRPLKCHPHFSGEKPCLTAWLTARPVVCTSIYAVKLGTHAQRADLILIQPIDWSANNSLSVVRCHFHEKMLTYKKFLKPVLCNFLNTLGFTTVPSAREAEFPVCHKAFKYRTHSTESKSEQG